MATSPVLIPLSAGNLSIAVDRADWPLDDLCAFAARDNPRRAFLVVSKVLGRHIAVKPSVMRRSFVDLAAKIPADLPGPVLVIGLAETAICLGQGVHEEYRRATGRTDILYLHSTRQEIDAPLLCRFEEPHSHASTHLIYRPPALDEAFATIRSLVIVDDEISTGTTVVNLATALIAVLPTIETVTSVTLANWSGTPAWLTKVPRPASVESLIEGTLTWLPGKQSAATADHANFDSNARSLGVMAGHYNFGRVGRSDIVCEFDHLAAGIPLAPASRLRVIGTGEFTYPPFRIAEILETAGHDVVVQSTTRSPAHIDGAIKSALRFSDNYGTAVPNYIYNVDPADERVTLICHETLADSVDADLIAVLSAHCLYFGA